VEGRLRFYESTLSAWLPDRAASLLVVAGGRSDRDVLGRLGFSDAVISNVDERQPPGAFAPYAWSHQDAEALGYADGSFDYVVCHAGLHHCHSPHRGLLEMYRVARRAIVAFEPRDTLLIRALERLGFAQVYEALAVFRNQGRFGGVRNGAIPNFVHRWSEREVWKTIASFAPHARPRVRFAYGTDDPRIPAQAKGAARRLALRLAMPAWRAFTAIAPRQQNLFAFRVEKPELPRDLQPWLRLAPDGAPRFDEAWARARFRERPADGPAA